MLDAHHLGVRPALDRARHKPGGRGLALFGAILVVAFVEMDELFVADEEVPNIHKLIFIQDIQDLCSS